MKTDIYIPRINGHTVVLGGSGGIGSEAVKALLALGAPKISMSYSGNKGRADELVANLTKEGYKVAAFHLKELGNPDELNRFLDQAVAWAGEEVSVALNTIGISPNTEIEEQTPEEWKKVYDVNATGNFFALRTMALRMRKHKIKGAIVTLSSDNARLSWSPISAHYDSSKAACELNVKHLAYHFAKDGIRVNAIAPGWTNTPMNNTLPEDERRDVTSRIWMGRFAEPAEVASVIALLASSATTFVTGQVWDVNGGFR